MHEDIISLLRDDHEHIKELFVRAQSAGESGDTFADLVEFLMRHEVAEEAVIYPAIRKLPDGEAIADARINEQAIAEEQLDDMERMEDPEFSSQLLILEQDVMNHVLQEEKTVFKLLEERATADELQELGEKYLKAKDAAPTHPHPLAPNTPPGNIFMGPVAALADRIRDAVYRQ